MGWFGWLSGRWLLHGLQIQNQYNMLQHQQRELQQEMERLQKEAETVETVKVFDGRLFQPPFRLNFKPLDIILLGSTGGTCQRKMHVKNSPVILHLTRIVHPRRRKRTIPGWTCRHVGNPCVSVTTCGRNIHVTFQFRELLQLNP